MNNKVNSRRDFIKTMAAATALAVVPQVMFGKEMQSSAKILVVYFSHTGNTKALGQQIQSIVGGDVFEIEPVTPYPSELADIRGRANAEKEASNFPSLKAKVQNINTYDVIFIGTPVWMGSYSVPISSFVAEHNLAGKTVIPFVTYNGNAGNSLEDLTNLFPNSKTLKGLSVKGTEVNESKPQISEWISSLGIK
jgi:flavodoxin